jgi:putative phage-type endonuclease
MGVSPWKTPLQLWEEKLGLSVGFQGNFATQRGHEMEPKARAAFELLMGADFSPVVAEHINYPFMRASLDGFNSELDAVLEIKCPGSDDQNLAKEGKVPDKYWPQLQHQLMVTGASKVYYYSYDGESGAVVEVKPELGYIEKLMDAEIKFWDMVQNKIQPPLTDKDATTIDNDEIVSVAEQYVKLDAEIKKLEKKLNEYKKQLVEKCDHARTKIGRLTITKSIRAGSVDYKEIKELEGVDLEQYRKAATTVVTIKVGK